MNKILNMLMDQWIYDIETLSEPWVIYTIFPAVSYAVFMLIKWFMLTCPIWMPFAAIIQIIKSK